MKELFHVYLEFELDSVVLAENENEAIDEAKDSIYMSDAEWFTSAKPIKERSDIPFGWEGYEPLAIPDTEEMSGTCKEIFDRIEQEFEEEERERRIKEEMDKKQLKFSFINEV